MQKPIKKQPVVGKTHVNIPEHTTGINMNLESSDKDDKLFENF